MLPELLNFLLKPPWAAWGARVAKQASLVVGLVMVLALLNFLLMAPCAAWLPGVGTGLTMLLVLFIFSFLLLAVWVVWVVGAGYTAGTDCTSAQTSAWVSLGWLGGRSGLCWATPLLAALSLGGGIRWVWVRFGLDILLAMLCIWLWSVWPGLLVGLGVSLAPLLACMPDCSAWPWSDIWAFCISCSARSGCSGWFLSGSVPL